MIKLFFGAWYLPQNEVSEVNILFGFLEIFMAIALIYAIVFAIKKIVLYVKHKVRKIPVKMFVRRGCWTCSYCLNKIGDYYDTIPEKCQKCGCKIDHT